MIEFERRKSRAEYQIEQKSKRFLLCFYAVIFFLAIIFVPLIEYFASK